MQKVGVLFLLPRATSSASAMFLPVLLSLGASPNTISAAPDVKEYLAAEGLACCTNVVMRPSGWLQRGGGVDAIGDLKYLSDADVESLQMPRVKQNILKALASRDRNRAKRYRQEEERRDGWIRNWLENLLAALETCSRGFMLGFGMSFVYESLLLNRDFYTATDDLGPRVRRAALRAAILGGATAAVLHGSALLIPHWLRYTWLAGSM